MPELSMEDLVYSYPKQNIANFQQFVSSRQEFANLATTGEEKFPEKRGDLFNHQELILRFFVEYDRLLMIHETGSGKTCGAVSPAEAFKDGWTSALANYFYTYLRPVQSHIRRVYILLRSSQLVREFKYQLVCKCTDGKYELETAKNASKESVARRLITQELKKYYTITTYRSFANDLRRKGLTEDDLRRQYSNCMFIVDEMQEIPVESDWNRQQNNKEVYETLWTLFHSVVASKIIGMTATPMINTASELAPVANLVLPDTRQLPENTNFQDWDVEDFRPYLEGYVSYVRAPDTGVVKDYQGVYLETEHGNDTMKIYPTQMSQFQQDVYESLSASGFRSAQRQAASIVFPNGDIGKEGFNKYVEKTGPDSYCLSQEFNRLLDRDGAETYMPKLKEKIDLCAEGPGPCFIFENYVANAILDGLLLEKYHGYSKYREKTSAFQDVSGGISSFCAGSEVQSQRIPKIGKAKRYALLTAETSDGVANSFMEVINSPENAHGKYIQVFIVTPVGREGINVSNMAQGHLEPGWNRSNTHQAESRFLRATSHETRIREEKEKRRQEGKDPVQTTFNVLIYQHAAVNDEGSSVDVDLYARSERKDRKIKNVLRKVKQLAFDCQIHKEKNIKGVDYSAACDYDVCDYPCADPQPEEIDRTAFNVLYPERYVKEFKSILLGILREKFISSKSELRDRIQELSSNIGAIPLTEEQIDRFIDITVDRLVKGKEVLVDSYGYRSFLREDRNMYFLQREYPLSSEVGFNRYWLSTYSSELVGVQSKEFERYVTEQIRIDEGPMRKRLFDLDPDSEDFETTLLSLSLTSQVDLLEEAVLQHVTGNEEWSSDILDALFRVYRNYLYWFPEPLNLISQTTEEARRTAFPQQRIKRINQEDLFRKAPPEEDPNNELVFVHTLYTKTFERNSYNVIAKAIKAEGDYRLLKISEGFGWRDATEPEYRAYNELVQRTIANRLSEFRQFSVYGVYSTTDNKFRVADVTKEKKELSKTDSRSLSRGKICKDWKKAEIISVLYKLSNAGVDVNRNIRNPPPAVDEETVRKELRNKRVTGVDKMSEEEARFLLQWLNSGKTMAQICRILYDIFQETGRLLVL